MTRIPRIWDILNIEENKIYINGEYKKAPAETVPWGARMRWENGWQFICSVTLLADMNDGTLSVQST